MSLELGLALAARPATPAGWGSIGDLSAAAEEAGAHSIWLTDHLYWHEPTLDVFAGLHAAAAHTTTARVGSCVLQLPLRDIASTAKSISYLESVAPGRVVAGVGIGEHPGEYELAGKAELFTRRGALLNEGIPQLRAAWTATSAGLHMAPGAAAPVWVGGRSAAARRRAARMGDGWIPHLCRASWFVDQMPLLDADLAETGRDPRAVVRTAVVAVHVDGIEPETDPTAWLGRLYRLPQRAFEHVVVRGSAAQVLEELHAFLDAGADEMSVVVAGDRPIDHLAALTMAAA